MSNTLNTKPTGNNSKGDGTKDSPLLGDQTLSHKKEVTDTPHIPSEETDVKKPLLVRKIKDDDLNSFENKTAGYGKWGLAIATLSLLVASVAGYFVFQQFKEMADQTELLHRTAEQARIAAKDSSVSTSQQLAVALRQVVAAQSSARAIQKQMIHDQQPWLKLEVGKTVDNPTGNMTVNLTVGGPLSIPVTLSNAGKTPARSVTTWLFAEVVPNGQNPHLPTHKGKKINGLPYYGGVPFPSDTHNVPALRFARTAEATPGQAEPLTPAEAQSLSEKTSYLAVWGVVRYCDIFAISHRTYVCKATLISGENAGIQKCTTFNDTDTDSNEEKCLQKPT